MMNTNLIDGDDFLYHYQDSLFKEDDSEPFKSANSKRYRMCLALAFSSERHCNKTTSDILSDNLQSYIDQVDNRNGVNNYAQATQELTANIKNDCKLWKSNLSKGGPKIESLLKQLPGDCYKTTNGRCRAVLMPNSNDITDFEKACDRLKEPSSSKTFKQNTLDSHFPKEVNDADILAKLHLPPDVNQPNSCRDKLYKFNNSYADCSAISKKSLVNRAPYNGVEAENDLPTAFPAWGSGFFSQKIGKSTVPSKRYGKGSDERPNEEENHIFNEKKPEGIGFKTAGQQLRMENQKKISGSNTLRSNTSSMGYHPVNTIKKSLGGKRGASAKFVPPIKSNSQEERFGQSNSDGSQPFEEELDERLKNIEPRMIELIKNEIMDSGAKVLWDDIAGLDFAKSTIQEIVVWPMLRPDIFTGLRSPPKGILLFGPPGTGKTLIGKCIASQSNATFFSISASSLTSKWIGEGEKMVRALFAVARVHQPAVVFIDEIDSLLSQRSDTEHESSRRLKTEFLVQLDGAATGEEERILVVGATNRPQELDEAARRRLVKRLYIPLPDYSARKQLVTNLMKLERNTLSDEETDEIAKLTDGYSGADIKNLCKEASLGPIRAIASSHMFQIKADQVRPVNIDDFKMALGRVRSSVSPGELNQYLVWDKQYGFSGTCVS